MQNTGNGPVGPAFVQPAGTARGGERYLLQIWPQN